MSQGTRTKSKQKTNDKKKRTNYVGHTTSPSDYPVLDTVEGVNVRKKNILSMYIHDMRFIRIIELVKETGLSAAKIVSLSSKPCECCKGKPVEFTMSDGTKVEIPRGLLYYKKEVRGGKTIVQTKRK